MPVTKECFISDFLLKTVWCDPGGDDCILGGIYPTWGDVRPWKLTWHWKITQYEIHWLIHGAFFSHVSFRGMQIFGSSRAFLEFSASSAFARSKAAASSAASSFVFTTWASFGGTIAVDTVSAASVWADCSGYCCHVTNSPPNLTTLCLPVPLQLPWCSDILSQMLPGNWSHKLSSQRDIPPLLRKSLGKPSIYVPWVWTATLCPPASWLPPVDRVWSPLHASDMSRVREPFTENCCYFSRTQVKWQVWYVQLLHFRNWSLAPDGAGEQWNLKLEPPDSWWLWKTGVSPMEVTIM